LAKTISNTKFTISLNEDGYFDLYIKDNVEILIEDVLLIIESQKSLCGESIPSLISGGKYATTNMDVMKFLAKNENMPYSKISAYVANSASQKLLGNFYLKINRPERPTRFFNDRDEAVNWIKQYL
jgi:hypothetical protein